MEPLEPRQLLATVTWDGGAGTTSWHDAANWSADVLPGVDDDVIIDAASPITIRHDQNTVTLVKSILNEEGLALSAGEISVSSLFRQNAAMSMTGGLIGGRGDFHLLGTLTWSAGTMGGTGRTFVLGPTGQVIMAGNVALSRALLNDAVLTWQSGNINLNNGSITNRATGTFNVQSPGTAFPSGGTSLLVNQGTLKRNGTSATTSTIDVRLNNSGVVQVVQGGLRFRGGGTSFSGSITANPFTTLTIASTTLVVQAISSLNGGGSFVFNSGSHTVASPFNSVGTLLVQGASLRLMGSERVVTALKLAAGTLTLSSAINPLTSMLWTGGNVVGPARLRIQSGSTLTITGAAEKVLQNSVLENHGTILWNGARLTLHAGVIENGGLFRAAGDRIRSFGGGSRIDTTGTFRKETGVELIISNANGGVAFNILSNGDLEIQAGNLRLLGGGVSTGVMTGSPTSGLIFGSIAYTIAAGVITGVPTIQIGGPVTWTAGTIEGPGLLVVLPGQTFNIAGQPTKILGRTLANNGVVNWSDGILQLDAVPFTIAEGATLNIGAANGLTQFGGDSSIDNFGTINKTGSGVLSLSSSNVRINNVGTLNVLGGTFALNGLRVAQMTGGTLQGGTWAIKNGASLDLVNATILVNNATISIAGQNAAFNALRLLTLNNGSLTISGTAFALQSNGAQYTNAGVLTLQQGALLAVTGRVIFGASSTFNTTVVNSTTFGRVTATGSVDLAGTVAGSFLFTPPGGSTFQFVSGTLRVGEFANEVIAGLPAGVNGEVQYVVQGARWRIL